VNELVTIFKALSDETRLRIVKLLENGERCVCDIVAALDLVQPKVSFHLGALKEAGSSRTGNRADGHTTASMIPTCSGECCSFPCAKEFQQLPLQKTERGCPGFWRQKGKGQRSSPSTAKKAAVVKEERVNG
jgi:predicted transcriptional regulator